MKHFPNARPGRLAGLCPVEHTRAPHSCSRALVLLLLAAFYAAGLVTGAILFGELLLTLHTP